MFCKFYAFCLLQMKARTHSCCHANIMKGLYSLYPFLFITPPHNVPCGLHTLCCEKPSEEKGDDKDLMLFTEMESSRRNFLLQAAVLPIPSILSTCKPCQAYEVERSSLVTSMTERSLATSIAIKPSLCNEEVSSYFKGDRIVHIVGTVHISEPSAELAGKVVHEIQPEALFLELDRKRFSRAFWNDIIPGITVVYRDSDGRLKSGQTIETKKNLLDTFINAINKPDDPNLRPGKEFIRAVEEGLKVGSIIVLGDQDMDLTMRRILNGFKELSLDDVATIDDEFTDLLQKYSAETSGNPEDLGSLSRMNVVELADFIESLKNRDAVTTLMGVIKRNAPRFYSALVTERDQYMAFGIDSLPFQSLVAVIGLGHIDGVGRNLHALGWKRISKQC